MTPVEALAVIRRSGTVEAAGGALKIRVPKSRLVELQPVLDVLRGAKKEVLSVLANTTRKPERSDQELDRATAVLNRAGVRSMQLESGQGTGIWSDLDSPEIREALRVLVVGQLPIRYLDGPGVPPRFKLRQVAGAPVPENVRVEMERHPAEPWTIRDRMLGSTWCFVPWPAEDPSARPHTIDPATGIWPIEEWGSSCGRGFVSDSRFGQGQPVIKRTNRQATRRWRSLKRP